MVQPVKQFAAPMVVLALLGCMAGFDKLRIDPHEADGFHARAAAAVAKVPRELGLWICNVDRPLPEDAKGLLQPNAFLDREYVRLGKHHHAQLLLVQCRDVRHMIGHYPPVCYPAHGCEIPRTQLRHWTAGGIKFDGTEYEIVFPQGERRLIRNFFVLPDGRIVPDMAAVNRAAKDYRELVFGVAQVQLLTDAALGQAEQDDAFQSLVGGNADLIEVLRSRGQE